MAQKNLLPMILLGLINIEKKTGYDLKKDFETEIGEFWSVKHSQIYLELKRLEGNGEIKSTTGFYGNKIEKTYYEITKKGKERLESWLDSYSDILNVNKDEFVLKLYFIKSRKDPRLQDLLQEQYRLRSKKLEHLKERMKFVFPNKESKNDNFGHYLILDHAIRREQEYVNWLEEILEK
ncbi:PadR family transcriptional regulator [Lachnospira multipara]|uniref:DNA-binding transcriptional regulator, PadR family n=1 Tax=Lachnospira multipara TaxID=28051 RepID=A0A1H5UZI3_9FIRM|nr:PadR family transcriptional regulator [Lachnospira multipara]SEF80360.1 DNA-binding transcriptional regulator, PadR family [Lachnospira multipara]